MKKYCVFFLAFWACCAISQNKQLLYGFSEVPQSLMLNPGGIVSQKKHFGIPFLSQIHFNAGASGVSAFDIFGKNANDINTRIRNKIFEMSSSDFFTVNQQLELISFGWRGKNDIYFSGGLYEELDFITYFPRDLAILAWEGNRDYIEYPFNLGELSFTADLLTTYHFGANKKLTDKLTAGMRVKVYSSIISFSSTNNSGTFTTSIDEDEVNIYDHTVEGADITVRSAGYASLRDLEGAGEVGSEILGRSLLGSNFGIGLDFGATYEFSDRITGAASILDFGVMFYENDIESYQAKGDYNLNGIELVFPPLANNEPALPYFDNLEDELEREIPIDTLTTNYTRWRPTKINASLEYAFGDFLGGTVCDCLRKGQGAARQQAIGAQLYSIFRPKGPQFATTLFYRRKFGQFLSGKVTYTADAFSASNIGLGAVVDIGKFNFYIAADNLLRYENIAKAKSVSLQLGFNIKIDEQ
jgi:Family of unknown function (DUF5723)